MRITFSRILLASFAAIPLWLLGCQPTGTAQHDGDDQHAEQVGHDHEGGEPQLTVGPQIATPDAAVVAFLNAVREGQHDHVETMLTKKARIEMANAGIHPQPPGSPDAQFTIGQVRTMPNEGGAHVDCTWTDSERTYDVTWILRQEDNSWRIAGMATRLFEDLEPLILNFENPNDMKMQVQAAEAEIARRVQANQGGGALQATRPDNTQPPSSLR